MSDTISGLNSSYLNGTYTNSTTSALESTLNNKDLSTSSSDELMEVCKDFEEYFAEQMVKSMLKMAKVDSSDDDNSYASIFGLSSDSSDSGMSTMSSYFGDGWCQSCLKHCAVQKTAADWDWHRPFIIR